ncbi:MAG: pilin [Candidatus Doudnabacteria bacterium]|nr:pilin [Candidatus Doudnabacteria bacterium]
MKKYLQLKYWQAAVVFGSILAMPRLVSAQSTGGDAFGSGLNGVGGLFPGTGGMGIGGATHLTGQNGLIYLVITMLLYIAGAIAIVFVIVGGYQYITSAGNEEAAEKGKQNVVNAIIGIVIIVLSFVIINVISNYVASGY